MKTDKETSASKILILATLSGGYRGADSVGQGHQEYAPNVYILPIMSAAIFPPEFYMKAFENSVDAIIVMYSGSDCPYKGAAEHTAKMINKTYELMKERGIEQKRLRMNAICTVCIHPFLDEVRKMNALLEKIGPLPHPAYTALSTEPLAS